MGRRQVQARTMVHGRMRRRRVQQTKLRAGTRVRRLVRKASTTNANAASARGGNPGTVDGFGDWDRAEGRGVAPLILCILHVLHVNTSVLPSSRSVAEYNSSSSNVTRTKNYYYYPCFRFRPFCTETDRQ